MKNSQYMMRIVFLEVFVAAAVLMDGAAATQFKVGGSYGWAPPRSGNMSDYHWAGKKRFLVGDELVFEYNRNEDSVVQVSAEDYDKCNTSNPIASFKGGYTEFQFSSDGPFYFVSGNSSNCNDGEKLNAVVLSHRLPVRGFVNGIFSPEKFGCCQNNCCDEENPLVCCERYSRP